MTLRLCRLFQGNAHSSTGCTAFLVTPVMWLPEAAEPGRKQGELMPPHFWCGALHVQGPRGVKNVPEW